MNRTSRCTVAGMLFSALVIFVPTTGNCRFNLPDVQKIVTVSREDHRILKTFFTGREADKPKKVASDNVVEVLRRNLPGLWKSEIGGSHQVTARVIHIEDGQGEKPILSFLVLGCDDRGAHTCDDNLVGLKVEKETTSIVPIAAHKECDSCSNEVKIVLERRVRVDGLVVIGVNFLTAYEIEDEDRPFESVTQEEVHFFVFDGGEVRQAGQVVKSRTETVATPGKGDTTKTYHGGIVFKKDMKGNITGILSPYTEKTGEGRVVDRGMLRLAWNSAMKQFVRE
jgi:hypothetical protein